MTGQDLQVRELYALQDLEQAVALMAHIWQSPEPSTGVGLLRALAHVGNYVAGAYRDGELVGASVAFLAAPVGRSLYSHVTCALPGTGAGYALKFHQRGWALDRGLDQITWTYDPLVRRNAYFNVAKLGAMPEQYLPSFYGSMSDGINAGDESDRALAVWRLTGPQAESAANGNTMSAMPAPDAIYALRNREGHPETGRTDASSLLVQLPPDIEALRRSDPALAKAWRLALRDVLAPCLASGYRVYGFHEKSSYLLTRDQELR